MIGKYENSLNNEGGIIHKARDDQTETNPEKDRQTSKTNQKEPVNQTTKNYERRRNPELRPSGNIALTVGLRGKHSESTKLQKAFVDRHRESYTNKHPWGEGEKNSPCSHQ